MSKKRRVQIEHWWCEVYQWNFYFFKGHTAEEFLTWLKRSWGYKSDTRSRFNGRCVVDVENGCAAIWVKDWSDIAIVGHECLHAVNGCLLSRGVQASFDNDEAQAYLLSAVLRRCR
jgi:hypothetical protein